MPGQPICSKCHKPLTDPMSIAIGMGPECRGGGGRSHKLTRSQVRHIQCIGRAESFMQSQPVVIGDVTFYKAEKGWTEDGKHFQKEEELKKWLERYHLADFRAAEVIQQNRMVGEGLST